MQVVKVWAETKGSGEGKDFKRKFCEQQKYSKIETLKSKKFVWIRIKANNPKNSGGFKEDLNTTKCYLSGNEIGICDTI